jgi:hypothetical protein
MSKYVEDYLISLGFDLDSDQGKQFLAISKEIEKQNQQTEKDGQKSDKSAQTRQKNSKSRVTQSKQELSTLAELQKSLKQVESVWSQVSNGNVFGAFASGMAGAKAFKTILDEIQAFTFKGIVPESKKGSSESQDIRKSVRAQVTAEPEQTTSQQASPIIANSQNVDDSKKSVDKFDDSIVLAGENMGGLKKVATSLFGDGTSSTGISAGAAESAGSIADIGTAAIVATGGIAAIVAAAAAAAVGVYSIADSVATANVNVESLAAQMWITDSAAWQLTNTLSAMGKTPADLSTIALNPDLNKQFKALQEYQETELKLPADFKNVNDEWVANVQTPLDEFKLTLTNLWQNTGYDLEKSLVGPLGEAINDATELVDGFEEVAGWVATIDEDIASFLSKTGILKSAIEGLLPPGVAEAFEALDTAKSLTSGATANKSVASSTPKSTTSPYQVYTVPDYTAAAPNSPSNSSVSSSSVNYTNAPQITVNANSSDPQTIAQSTAAAVQQSNNTAALIKSIQGVSR